MADGNGVYMYSIRNEYAVQVYLQYRQVYNNGPTDTWKAIGKIENVLLRFFWFQNALYFTVRLQYSA